MPPPRTNQMRGVVRALKVLRVLNAQHGARISELAKAAGIPRPTLYRILDTLDTLGYVRKREDSERYELTMLVRTLSDGFTDEDWVRNAARPIIEALQKDIVWPTDIATFHDDAMYLRETTRRSSPLTIDNLTVGIRMPLLLSATGRAYLASCPDEERETIIENLRRSKDAYDARARDARFVRNLLEMTRRNGYGERHGEVYPKTGAIAVPVLHATRVACCLNISFIASALSTKEAATRYLAPLKEAAKAVEARLQYHPPSRSQPAQP